MTKNDDTSHGLARGLTDYGDRGFSLYLRRSFAASMGYSREALDRPIVGIAWSPSGFNNCHRQFPELLEAVKRGVMASGGLPVEFPTISLGEVFLSPTSLVYRNLMSMDVEEMIRAQPMDAVVLMGGCDKTVPAQLMGAASAGLPAIQLVAGPMMTGRFKGERLGACTDCRRFWARHRAGELGAGEIDAVEANLATTAGTCAVMGTASTMACIAEALGMSLPGTAAIPAVHADRLRAGEATGTAAMRLAAAGLTPERIVTPAAVENALRVLLAIGGSTNAIIHLTAIAGRLGIEVSLERLNELSDETPVLVDLKPTGAHYMEDFHAAGGLGAVLRELREMLHLDCLTVTGETLGQRLEAEPGYVDNSVIRPLGDPVAPVGGLVALFGSLAPRGAILKRSAADPSLFEREGRAVVFSSLADLARRIDDPDLEVTPEDLLVLANAGPTSDAGMPEAGYLPIPSRLARAGAKDMVRISDARMSGTAFGTVVLHVTPEAAAGGPLALVRSGDRIRLSVAGRRLDLCVADEELARRRAEWEAAKARRARPLRGYRKLYMDSVLQADRGCDFDFLTAAGAGGRASSRTSRRGTMGRHINERGQFQSDKYPDLAPDRVVLSFDDPRAWPSLMGLARRYEDIDSDFSRDILMRLETVEYGSAAGDSEEGRAHAAGRHAETPAGSSRREVGRHINERGEFQSDKYPDLPPDRLVVSFRDVRAWPSLMGLARRYEEEAPEFAADIRTRLQTIELVEKS